MKRFSKRALAVAATIAALALASPTHAQTSTKGVEPVVVPNFPTEAEVAAICNLDTDFAIGRLLIPDVAAVSPGTVSGDTYLGVTLEVSITDSGSAFEDVTDPSQRAGTPGWEAVVAGSSDVFLSAGVYCYVNERVDSNIKTPSIETPTRLEFYASRGPCLLPDTNVDNACAAYNGPPGNPANQAAHFLQEHLVDPEEPINICGCPFDAGAGVVQRIAEFCDPSLPTGDQGACPTGEGGLTGLETQATATSGSATCHRIVIGGRAIFIGDTC